MKKSSIGFGSRGNAALQAVSLLAAALIIFMLFWGGSQPVAVGLFPASYDKLAHFATFAALSFSFWLGVDGKWPFGVFMLVAAIGGLDELHQLYLPGRQAGWDDFLVDAVAAGFVMVLPSKNDSAFHQFGKRFTRSK